MQKRTNLESAQLVVTTLAKSTGHTITLRKNKKPHGYTLSWREGGRRRWAHITGLNAVIRQAVAICGQR